jgi:hypothetical protein
MHLFGVEKGRNDLMQPVSRAAPWTAFARRLASRRRKRSHVVTNGPAVTRSFPSYRSRMFAKDMEGQSSYFSCNATVEWDAHVQQEKMQ